VESLTTLFDSAPVASATVLTSELQAIYGGDLAIATNGVTDRPYIIANFVASLDGVVAFGVAGSDTGSAISGGSVVDHMVMGILRAEADAVLWGARNYMVARRFLATPAAIWPAGAAEYQAMRARLGKAPTPLAVVVSASGNIDPTGAIFRQAEQPALVVTTDAGALRLEDLAVSAPNTTVRSVATGATVPPAAVARLLWEEFGVRTLLHEGGPQTLGAFLAAGLIDEIFLTIAPQFIGRSDAAPRPGLVEGAAFLPTSAPWAKLLSLKQSSSYLFTRYAVVGPR
jgi:riboflavin biosynthesis pyrimidine reductase